MAIQQQQQQQHQNQSLPLDALYCEECLEDVGEECLEEERESDNHIINNGTNPTFLLPPLLLLEQDLFWEDEELLSLFSKEQQIHLNLDINNDSDSALILARKEAVGWILKVNTHYGFAALTAILAINYLDGFLSSLHFQRDNPWMTQLVAVTCLSLAAKVEETQVPLLLDLQVEDTKYVFEAKTIQRMELLVLSSLQWRMNPVTPLSFLDHIIRRLGLKTHLHWEFLRRCEVLLLCVVADWRFVGYLPSVLATATMLQVIHQVKPCNSIEYQNQLLGVLKTSRERVNDCYQLIGELSSCTSFYGHQKNNPHKRKYEQEVPESPSGVIEFDASLSPDCSNDSWSVGLLSVSSPAEPLIFKKSRATEQQMSTVPSLSRVFVNILGSPSWL